MSVILAAVFVFLFFVFLALGIIAHYKQINRQWFYFIVSAISLIGTVLMFVFFDWNLQGGIKTGEPKIVIFNEHVSDAPAKNNPIHDLCSNGREPQAVKP